jgi:hypothetical protein
MYFARRFRFPFQQIVELKGIPAAVVKLIDFGYLSHTTRCAGPDRRVFFNLGKTVQANITMAVIGEEEWDEIIVAEYPSIAAFIEMNRDKDYQHAVQHRTEALLDSRLYLVKADEARTNTTEWP